MYTFKALIGLIVYGLTAVFIVLTGGFIWGVSTFKSPGPLLVPFEFTVEPGMGLSGIAGALENQGAISNRFVFIAGTRLLNRQGDLKAGEYALQPAISMEDALDLIVSGEVIKRRFTVREGLTSYEIVNMINAYDGLGGEVIDAIPREGSLLPETYAYQRDEPRARLIRRMQSAMNKTLDDLWAVRAPDLPFDTKKEALTLASIIEKETGQADERERIAGVFINRLKKNMPLQTDPTVIYALTAGRPEDKGRGPLGRRLLRKDLQYNSPYNTYLYPGLPPGPIANPGRASIKAALNPETHDYFYFVADGTGGHAFARTLTEHNKNVNKWRKIRNKSR